MCLVPDLPLGLLSRRSSAISIEKLTTTIIPGLVQVNDVVPAVELEGLLSDGITRASSEGTNVSGMTTENTCVDQAEKSKVIWLPTANRVAMTALST